MTETIADPLTRPGEPFADARGPHLPDPVTGLPWLVWPFLALFAMGASAAWTTNGPDLVRDPSYLTVVLPVLIIDLAAPLIGVALLVRHRDAVTTLPVLVAGAGLLAIEPILRLAREALGPVFQTITPASEALPFFVPLGTGYDVFVIVVAAAGLILVGLGLSRSRRYDDPISPRFIGLGLGLLAVVIAAARLLLVRELPAEVSSIMPVLVAVSVVYSVAFVGSWSYLTGVAFLGWVAGERPRIGWVLATAGGLAILMASAIDTVVSLIGPTSPDGNIFAFVVSWMTGAGWLLLLLAFVSGLPSTRGLASVEVASVERATDDPEVGPPPGSAGS